MLSSLIEVAARAATPLGLIVISHAVYGLLEYCDYEQPTQSVSHESEDTAEPMKQSASSPQSPSPEPQPIPPQPRARSPARRRGRQQGPVKYAPRRRRVPVVNPLDVVEVESYLDGDHGKSQSQHADLKSSSQDDDAEPVMPLLDAARRRRLLQLRESENEQSSAGSQVVQRPVTTQPSRIRRFFHQEAIQAGIRQERERKAAEAEVARQLQEEKERKLALERSAEQAEHERRLAAERRAEQEAAARELREQEQALLRERARAQARSEAKEQEQELAAAAEREREDERERQLAAQRRAAQDAADRRAQEDEQAFLRPQESKTSQAKVKAQAAERPQETLIQPEEVHDSDRASTAYTTSAAQSSDVFKPVDSAEDLKQTSASDASPGPSAPTGHNDDSEDVVQLSCSADNTTSSTHSTDVSIPVELAEEPAQAHADQSFEAIALNLTAIAPDNELDTPAPVRRAVSSATKAKSPSSKSLHQTAKPKRERRRGDVVFSAKVAHIYARFRRHGPSVGFYVNRKAAATSKVKITTSPYGCTKRQRVRAKSKTRKSSHVKPQTEAAFKSTKDLTPSESPTTSPPSQAVEQERLQAQASASQSSVQAHTPPQTPTPQGNATEESTTPQIPSSLRGLPPIVIKSILEQARYSDQPPEQTLAAKIALKYSTSAPTTAATQNGASKYTWLSSSPAKSLHEMSDGELADYFDSPSIHLLRGHAPSTAWHNLTLKPIAPGVWPPETVGTSQAWMFAIDWHAGETKVRFPPSPFMEVDKPEPEKTYPVEMEGVDGSPPPGQDEPVTSLDEVEMNGRDVPAVAEDEEMLESDGPSADMINEVLESLQRLSQEQDACTQPEPGTQQYPGSRPPLQSLSYDQELDDTYGQSAPDDFYQVPLEQHSGTFVRSDTNGQDNIYQSTAMPQVPLEQQQGTFAQSGHIGHADFSFTTPVQTTPTQPQQADVFVPPIEVYRSPTVEDEIEPTAFGGLDNDSQQIMVDETVTGNMPSFGQPSPAFSAAPSQQPGVTSPTIAGTKPPTMQSASAAVPSFSPQLVNSTLPLVSAAPFEQPSIFSRALHEGLATTAQSAPAGLPSSSFQFVEQPSSVFQFVFGAQPTSAQPASTALASTGEEDFTADNDAWAAFEAEGFVQSDEHTQAVDAAMFELPETFTNVQPTQLYFDPLQASQDDEVTPPQSPIDWSEFDLDGDTIAFQESFDERVSSNNLDDIYNFGTNISDTFNSQGSSNTSQDISTEQTDDSNIDPALLAIDTATLLKQAQGSQSMPVLDTVQATGGDTSNVDSASQTTATQQASSSISPDLRDTEPKRQPLIHLKFNCLKVAPRKIAKMKTPTSMSGRLSCPTPLDMSATIPNNEVLPTTVDSSQKTGPEPEPDAHMSVDSADTLPLQENDYETGHANAPLDAHMSEDQDQAAAMPSRAGGNNTDHTEARSDTLATLQASEDNMERAEDESDAEMSGIQATGSQEGDLPLAVSTSDIQTTTLPLVQQSANDTGRTHNSQAAQQPAPPTSTPQATYSVFNIVPRRTELEDLCWTADISEARLWIRNRLKHAADLVELHFSHHHGTDKADQCSCKRGCVEIYEAISWVIRREAVPQPRWWSEKPRSALLSGVLMDLQMKNNSMDKLVERCRKDPSGFERCLEIINGLPALSRDIMYTEWQEHQKKFAAKKQDTAMGGSGEQRSTQTSTVAAGSTSQSVPARPATQSAPAPESSQSTQMPTQQAQQPSPTTKPARPTVLEELLGINDPETCYSFLHSQLKKATSIFEDHIDFEHEKDEPDCECASECFDCYEALSHLLHGNKSPQPEWNDCEYSHKILVSHFHDAYLNRSSSISDFKGLYKNKENKKSIKGFTSCMAVIDRIPFLFNQIKTASK